MSTKKLQIIDYSVKQAENADTLDGKHAVEFASASDVSDLQSKVGDTSVAEQITSAVNSAGVLTIDTTDAEAGTAPMTNANLFDGKTWSELMLAIYPVGSIYISANETSPASLFGGTWESISGKFLLGADDAYPAGSTGGEAKHTLTESEMPRHTHTLQAKVGTTIGSSISSSALAVAQNYSGMNFSAATVTYTGSGASHNNMPPYLAVYMWRRTA